MLVRFSKINTDGCKSPDLRAMLLLSPQTVFARIPLKYKHYFCWLPLALAGGNARWLEHWALAQIGYFGPSYARLRSFVALVSNRLGRHFPS